jgi:hypothetical protein
MCRVTGYSRVKSKNREKNVQSYGWRFSPIHYKQADKADDYILVSVP